MPLFPYFPYAYTELRVARCQGEIPEHHVERSIRLLIPEI